MGFFSRKEERPRIPPSPVLPEIPEREYSRSSRSSELPSIPSNRTHDNLNQEMVKSAMEDMPSPEEKEDLVGELPRPPRLEARDIPSPPSFGRSVLPLPPVEGQPRRETIFVKIDQFNNALDSLNEIEGMIRELSTDINTLKEVKVKEVEELNAWDEELKKVNARLTKIDSTIFGEV